MDECSKDRKNILITAKSWKELGYGSIIAHVLDLASDITDFIGTVLPTHDNLQAATGTAYNLTKEQ